MKDSVQLLRKLNESCAKALNEAAGFCLARGHHEILPEHWVIKLIEQDHNDLNLLLRQQQIDQNRLWDELLAGLERLPWRRGQQKPELSEHINKWLAQAWLIASVEYGQTEIRSLHLVQALQKSPSMFSVADVWPLLLWRAGQLQEASQWLDQHSSEAPRSEHFMPTAAATEPAQTAPDAAAATPSSSGLSAGQQTPAQAEALQRFTVNLTARARDGHIDAIFGRDDEISQLEDILSRRRKNNPILVGDPGVGKTALAEGLARRIAQDEVGQHLRNVDIVALDLGLLQAGAGLKGEFEQRLKNVIEGIQNAPTPTILFIDEAHTLIGAGNQAGSGDAANLLKPALARGQLRTIAATTWSEYKQYFETDAALERRFQPVKVAEPDDEKACQMLRGIAVQYANHHGIHIQDEAIVAAVTLSRRYLPDRQLPDKAIDLIDTAAAKVAIGLQEAPLSIIKLRSQQAALTTEIDTLTQDQALGHAVNGSRWAECQRQLAAASAELSAAEAQFAQEKAAATAVLAARQDEAGTADSLQQHNAAFKAQQHYLSVDVDAESIATVISEWTGVPAGRLLDDELKRLMTLDDALKRSVIGQDDALAQLSSHLRTTKAGLGHAQRPLGVFLLTGPSGIGKTQTAKALAAELFGSEQALISINMSEYQEAHTVAQLKGAPPGYVGYGKGGVLTEAVRKRPYAVVLLDEIEKAHPDVLNIFYQVFDQGVMRDGEGRLIDFKNTVLLLTANLGSAELEAQPEADFYQRVALVQEPVLAVLPPALLGRMTLLPYRALGLAAMQAIVVLQLTQLQHKIKRQFQADSSWGQGLIDGLATSGVGQPLGVRHVEQLFHQQIVPQLAWQLLSGQQTGDAPPAHVHLDFVEGNLSITLSPAVAAALTTEAKETP